MSQTQEPSRHDEHLISPEVQAEIDAAMGEISKPKPSGEPRPGIRGPRVVQAGREHRTGQVVSVGPTDVFVQFGPKDLGVVARSQWGPGMKDPALGDELQVVVDRFESGEGIYVCSLPGAIRKADWELLEPGQVIEARVTGVVKGGIELEVAGHRAFMPGSQVSLDRIEDLSVYVGEKLVCQVDRVDRRGKGNIVLTRRPILQQEREQAVQRMRETLQEGQVVEGVVRKIMAFGVFVDVGGVDGLVHISDLTHERITHGEKAIARHVKEGEKVRVQILKVDWEAKRLSLGMKQIQADPFSQAVNDITEGAEVTGRVTKIMEFGAFVELAPGVEGLVHISELAHRRVGRVEDVLKPDEVVKAKVIKIDRDTRRIGLSVKALQPAPERKDKDTRKGPTYEEIMKETPALRRLRERSHQMKLKGGI